VSNTGPAASMARGCGGTRRRARWVLPAAAALLPLLAGGRSAGAQDAAGPVDAAASFDGGAAMDGAAPIKVACAGEHTTNSVYVDDAEEYPARLQALLGGGYQVMNFGYPRATVQTENITFPNAMPLVQTMEFAASLAYRPDIVVIGPFGRHDSAADYANVAAIDRQKFTAGLQAIVRAYRALPGSPRIYLALPVPYPFGTGEGVMSAVVLPATRDVARIEGLPVIDHWSYFLGKRELFSNADHFTPDGIQRMAELVRDTILAQGDGGAPAGGGAPATASSSGCSLASGTPAALAPVILLAALLLRRRRRAGQLGSTGSRRNQSSRGA
jgi:MYXO-CTERM domain-containing protein